MNLVFLVSICDDVHHQRRTGKGGERDFPLEFCVRRQFVSDRNYIQQQQQQQQQKEQQKPPNYLRNYESSHPRTNPCFLKKDFILKYLRVFS